MAVPWFQPHEDRLLRERDVCKIVSVGRSTLRRWVSKGTFPPPLRIGSSAIRWKLSTVQKWIDSKET